MRSYKQVLEIRKKNEERIKNLCKNIKNESGIYIFFKTDENGFKKCYCGQARHLIERLAQHLNEYDYIGLSLKKWGLKNENKNGWDINYYYCDLKKLDEEERKAIKNWYNRGYIPMNKTIGGQNAGKVGLNANKPAKGYRDGLKKGYTNARVDVSKLFEKNLTFSINGKSTINKEKAFEKFKDFIDLEKELL